MAFKLEDLINKKKAPNEILDLSKIKIKSKDELEKYYDKIPEYKIRPEKVRPEDSKVRDTNFSFTLTKKDAKIKKKHEFKYCNPVPVSMRSVRLEDLAAVDINWRMLTMARPKNKLEEDIFSRIVELDKLKINTLKHNKIQSSFGSNIPGSQSQLATLGIIVTKNKRGVTQTRVKSCKECGEELCTGQWCKEYSYDSYTRRILDKDEAEKQKANESRGKRNRKGSKFKNDILTKHGIKINKSKITNKNLKPKFKLKKKIKMKKKKSIKFKKTDDESE